MYILLETNLTCSGNCQENLDILLITKTKLDSSFPDTQFHINGYTSPYRQVGGRSFAICKRRHSLKDCKST